MSYYKADNLFSIPITPGNLHSPLNYTGSKFRLLPQILPLFPKNIGTFVDLFCGGCNVGINVNASLHLFNDIQKEIIELYKTMIEIGEDDFIAKALRVIDTYTLVNRQNKQYQNKDNFIKLREETNKLEHSEEYYINLFVLVQFSFCNQIRFNSNGEFNVPIGDGCFTTKKVDDTRRFIRRLTELTIEFSADSFIDFNYDRLDSNSFVYLDPPYLITDAVYNSIWSREEEVKLLNVLDTLSSRNIKWALSNVLETKGNKNNILSDWLTNSNYTAHHLDIQYTRDNHAQGQHTHFTDEVLITNY